MQSQTESSDMKITREQQNKLHTFLDLIGDDTAFIFTRVEGGEFDPRALGEVADKVVTWATQLTEALYDLECEDVKGDNE